MKNYNHKKITSALRLLLALLFISSCEKDAKVKLPKVDQKLVVVSFISPQDSIIKVQLSLSQPLYNTSNEGAYKPLQGANVTISSVDGTYALVYNSAYEAYVIDSLQLKIRAGVTYVLDVSSPDGKKASARTTIPAINTSLQYVLKPSDWSVAGYSVNVTWQDPDAEDNYYRLFLESRYFYINYQSGPNGVTEDTVYARGVQAELKDDLSNPGGILKNQNIFSYTEFENEDNYFCLLHVTKEYYDYHNRLYEAGATGNPFAEPVQMPNNVSGGFGLFGGYNMYKVKLEPQ